MIKANDPSLKSWIEVPPDSDFPIQNLPFGIFKTQSSSSRVGIAIGDQVLDMSILNKLGFLDDFKIDDSIFTNQYLNDFIELGKPLCRSIRQRVSNLLNVNNPELRDNKNAQYKVLNYMSNVQMQLPVKIGDYTDFYSDIERNIAAKVHTSSKAGISFRKHLPLGYNGRASSIVVSGTSFHRPKGQIKPFGSDLPVFDSTKQLDFGLEVAFIVGKQTPLGKTVSTATAEDHIFGLTLLNGWSAHDFHTPEDIQPGLFLSKRFITTISPWIVTLDALEPFRTQGCVQDPKVLPYLEYSGEKNIDINLEVSIQPENSDEHLISKSNCKNMYWTIEQQLAHLTSNGCNINIGDLIASRTICAQNTDSFGSMLELSLKEMKAIKLKDGSERKFINDNDTVIIRGYCEKNGVRIGFGEAKGKVLEALNS